MHQSECTSDDACYDQSRNYHSQQQCRHLQRGIKTSSCCSMLEFLELAGTKPGFCGCYWVLWALCVVPRWSLCTINSDPTLKEAVRKSWTTLHLHTVLTDGHAWRRRLLLPKIRTAVVPRISLLVLSLTDWVEAWTQVFEAT